MQGCISAFRHFFHFLAPCALRLILVLQVQGLWVSAFGDFDKRKSSTPGAARVRSAAVSELMIKDSMRSKAIDQVDHVAIGFLA